MRYWRRDTQNITVAVAPKSAQLGPRSTLLSNCYIWADRSNSTFVCIGTQTLVCSPAARPNSAMVQLDPGRGMEIWVDDPDTEYFDLGDYWCASDSATIIQFLYVSSCTFTGSRLAGNR